MSFEPLAGFPPIIREEDTKIPEKTLESRGFSTTNIVSINKIMDSKKKENLFIAFGSEDEDGVDQLIQEMFDKKPNEYNDIVYKNSVNKNSVNKNISKKNKS